MRTHHRRGRRASTLLAAGVCGLALTAAACSSSHPSTAQTSEPPLGFRSAPSFLPTATQPVDQIVTAAPGHPQLAVQGVAVQVNLPSGQVLATVTGPVVPPFVAPPPPSVTATFTISLSNAAGTVPVSASAFSITDQLGRNFHPTLVNGEAAPPATAAAGKTVTFKLNAVMPTGEGRIYWAPDGGTPIVAWDFIVEND